MGHIFAAINWQLEHPEIRSADFFEGPAFSAVDTLFIDPGPVSDRWTYSTPVEKDGARRTYTDSDRGFGRVITKSFHRRRAEASDLLHKAGGLIVCRLRPRGEALEVISKDGVSERIDRYSWFPTVSLVDKQHQLNFPSNARFLPRRGADVIFEGTGTPFEEYLRQFAGRIAYSAVYQDILSTPIERFAMVLARNRVGDVLAMQIPYDEGLLILLPPIEGASPVEEGLSLMRAAERTTLRPGFFSQPDWLPSYPVPNEDSLHDELAGLINRRDKLSQKIEEITAKLEETTRQKRMLYTHGRFSVVPAVIDSLRTLGFEVEEAGRDLIVRCEEGDAIVAVAATDSTAVGLPYYRHLLNRVDRARTGDEGPSKGILIVNASCTIDPKRRPTQFTPAVLRGCKSQGFCLITTYSLYKLVQRVLAQGKAAPSDSKDLARIRKALIECDGEFREVP